MTASPIDKAYKLIAGFTSGNAMGVVTEPLVLDPARPLREQQMVKIGPIDRELARQVPYPKKDFQKVVEQLIAFLGERKGR